MFRGWNISNEAKLRALVALPDMTLESVMEELETSALKIRRKCVRMGLQVPPQKSAMGHPGARQNMSQEASVTSRVFSKEQLAEIKRLIKEGAPSHQIMRDYDLSRSSLISLANRMGLVLREDQPDLGRMKALRSKKGAENAHAKLGAPLEGAPLVPLIDLEKDMCRWPHDVEGRTLFCGCPTLGKDAGPLSQNYCQTHADMAFRRKGKADPEGGDA